VIGVAKRKIVYPHLTGGGFLFIFRAKKQHAGALTLVVTNNSSPSPVRTPIFFNKNMGVVGSEFSRPHRV